MGIVRFLIFASLVAGTLGFFWPKFGQEEIRPWDLADQMEEEARLEKLCQEDDSYCLKTKQTPGSWESTITQETSIEDFLEKLCQEDFIGCSTSYSGGRFPQSYYPCGRKCP